MKTPGFTRAGIIGLLLAIGLFFSTATSSFAQTAILEAVVTIAGPALTVDAAPTNLLLSVVAPTTGAGTTTFTVSPAGGCVEDLLGNGTCVSGSAGSFGISGIADANVTVTGTPSTCDTGLAISNVQIVAAGNGNIFDVTLGILGGLAVPWGADIGVDPDTASGGSCNVDILLAYS